MQTGTRCWVTESKSMMTGPHSVSREGPSGEYHTLLLLSLSLSTLKIKKSQTSAGIVSLHKKLFALETPWGKYSPVVLLIPSHE